MTLDRAQVGTSYEILKINLPLQVEKRLEALGMTLGSKIAVLSNKNRGTLIVKVRGSRFAIGRGISQNIDVRG